MVEFRPFWEIIFATKNFAWSFFCPNLNSNHPKRAEKHGAHFVVCQYYPKGNMYNYQGRPHHPYIFGQTGSNCPKGKYGDSNGFADLINLSDKAGKVAKKLKRDIYEPKDFRSVTSWALCNNKNEICGDDNRCPRGTKCVDKDGISFRCRKLRSKRPGNKILPGPPGSANGSTNTLDTLASLDEYQKTQVHKEVTIVANRVNVNKIEKSNERKEERSGSRTPRYNYYNAIYRKPVEIVTPLPFKKPNRVQATLTTPNNKKRKLSFSVNPKSITKQLGQPKDGFKFFHVTFTPKLLGQYVLIFKLKEKKKTVSKNSPRGREEVNFVYKVDPFVINVMRTKDYVRFWGAQYSFLIAHHTSYDSTCMHLFIIVEELPVFQKRIQQVMNWKNF